MTRIVETIALTALGDGIVAVLIPSRHSRRWKHGPQAWQRTMRMFAENPALTRALGAAEAAAALAIALRLPQR